MTLFFCKWHLFCEFVRFFSQSAGKVEYMRGGPSLFSASNWRIKSLLYMSAADDSLALFNTTMIPLHWMHCAMHWEGMWAWGTWLCDRGMIETNRRQERTNSDDDDDDGDDGDDDGDDGDDYSSEHKCPTSHMVSSITTMRKGISSPQWGVPPGFCRNLSKRTNFLTSTNLMWGRHKSGVEASTNLAVHTNLLLVCINHPCFQKHPNRRQLAPNKHDNLLASKTTVDLVDLMNKEHE